MSTVRMWMNEAKDHLVQILSPLFNNKLSELKGEVRALPRRNHLGIGDAEHAWVAISVGDQSWKFTQLQYGGAETDTITLIEHPASGESVDWFDWPWDMNSVSLTHHELPNYESPEWEQIKSEDFEWNIALSGPVTNIVFRDDSIIIASDSLVVIASAPLGPDYRPLTPQIHVYRKLN